MIEQPKKIGRPRKQDVESKKPTKRGKVGRPPGDASIINEYKARMLASPKSKRYSTVFLMRHLTMTIKTKRRLGNS